MTATQPQVFCGCGCGTEIFPYEVTNGIRKKGMYARFVQNHHARTRRTAFDYTVAPDGCWISVSRQKGNGYVHGTPYGTVHRAVYAQEHGQIPHGYQVHHLCEKKRCINPDHLEALSPAKHADRHVKRLSATEKAEVRSLLRAGWHRPDVAAAYGLSGTAVYHYADPKD